MIHPTHKVRVVRRVEEAEGVVSLELRRADGRDFPTWDAGTHVEVHLPGGLTRQYSLCSAVEDSQTWRIGVLRELNGRGGSAYVHESVLEGTTLEIGEPRNNFQLAPSTSYRFIAGGIGITPIIPMLREAERLGADWTLLYGGRTRASMAFVDELESYGDKVEVSPQDEFGILNLPEFLKDPREGELIFACGPAPMLDGAERASEHWPSGSLHVERFVAAAVDTTADEEFEVEFVLTGKTVTIGTEQTILGAAEGLGLNVFSSCREGTCGTCETVVLDGQVDHRDVLLNAEERAANDSMMICVSRAKRGCSKLKIEL